MMFMIQGTRQYGWIMKLYQIITLFPFRLYTSYNDMQLLIKILNKMEFENLSPAQPG